MRKPPSAEPPPEVVPEAAAVVQWANRARREVGVRELTIHAGLMRAAQHHARNMAAAGRLAHTLPGADLPSFADRLRHYGIAYRAAGENIAQGQRTAGETVQNWLDSPRHRANLLDADYTHTGAGYVVGYWVQVYAQLAAATAADAEVICPEDLP